MEPSKTAKPKPGQPKHKDYCQTVAQYIRNPENFPAIFLAYESLAVKLWPAVPLGELFRDYKDAMGWKGAGKVKQPLKTFGEMPQLVCDFVRPILETMVGGNLQIYFKKTFLDERFDDGREAVKGIRECLTKILDKMGKDQHEPEEWKTMVKKRYI